jgi:hypothetical protein
MMQQGVDVVKDVFVADRLVGVVPTELRDGGVFEVGEGEALALSSADGFIR